MSADSDLDIKVKKCKYMQINKGRNYVAFIHYITLIYSN